MIIGNSVFIWFKLPKKITGKPLISGRYIEKKLRDQFKSLKYVEMLDNFYQAISLNDLRDLLRFNYFRKQRYISDVYDCDNYAFSLKGLFSNIAKQVPLGIVHVDVKTGGKHSLNLFYDHSSKSFYYLEPQTNKVFKSSSYEPYLVII